MIFVILLTIVIGLLAYVYKLLRQQNCYWQNLGIPCEEPQLLVGNASGIGETISFLNFFQNYYDKYKNTGPFAGIYWFFRKAVVVVDPTLIKQILIKDFSKFTDRGMFVNEEDDPLTGHLFNLDGIKWKNMRHKLSPTFTSGKMKAMFPIVIKIGEDFVDAFDESIAKDPIIDVRDLMARFTADVIGGCAFGLELSSLKDQNNKFIIMGKKALVEHRYGNLGVAFRFSFPKLAKKLRMKETPADVEDYFLGIARETIRYREENNVRRNDFMDMLIDLKNNKLMKSETGEEMTNMTFEEIAAQAFVFLVAGYESSSLTLGFVLYELAQNEDIQQRAREEVIAILKNHNYEFNYECMKEMQYLNQVIAETLRFHTIVPTINRMALEDYPVPGHPKYVIKKDMPILIPAGSIHRDARYYPNPDIFNPDNFSPDKVAERDSVLYLPFGDGPRNFIGLRFAKMQTSVGLAVLLKNFKFSVCEKTPFPMTYDKKTFLTSSEHGIYLKVTKL